MKDINNKEIVAGSLVKKMGTVVYADGPKEKVSKKTWLAVETEDGVKLTRDDEFEALKPDAKYLVVGDVENGLSAEYQPDNIVSPGSVPVNYRALVDVPERGWNKGDVITIIGKVSKETLEKGILERVDDNVENKHVLVIVDPVLVANQSNN